MVFGLMDTKFIVSVFALALIVLAIVFFGLAAVLHVVSWVKGKVGKKKGKEGRKEEHPQEKVDWKEQAQKPNMEIIAARLNRETSLVEFFDKAGERIGYALVRDEWNNASLPQLHLPPQETVAAEAHPLRARDVGVLTTVVDSITRRELAMLGTIYKKAGWSGAPKPIYGLDGNVVLEFKEVEATGGLASAKLVDSAGKRVGSIYVTGPNAWNMEYMKELSMDMRVLLIAFAQLISEQGK